MAQEQIKKFDSNKSIEKELKQYIKIIDDKRSKYESLADMKRQFLVELCSDAYSNEYLDLLKEIAKVMILDVNEDISVGTPMWNAFYIALLTLIASNNENYKIWYVSLLLILIIIFICFRKKYTLKRIGFYKMLLELIGIAEELRECTFYKDLKKEISKKQINY